MSKNIVKVETISSANFIGGAGTATNMYGPVYIGDMKEFAVTVQLCSSHGIGFGVFTSPIKDEAYFICQTGGAITSGVHTPLTLNVINNNMNWLEVRASATAVNSASLITLVFSSLERDM